VLDRLKAALRSLAGRILGRSAALGHATADAAQATTTRVRARVARERGTLVALGALAIFGYAIYTHPPVVNVGRGEIGVRANHLTGVLSVWRDGSVLVVPGVHELRVYSVRDQVYQPADMRRADGPAPLQSVEGLSLGVDLSVRYALDAVRLAELSASLPDSVAGDIVEPAVQGTIYRIFARYTVREIFSTKRAEIQQAIESELESRLARDGLLLRGVQIGNVDLPADYRRGMESLLAEELATQKMRYTLELKDKRVRETALDGEAEKVRREKAAEAGGQAQVIAARAQREAMKHVIPFKQRQIEQRKLEAEARRVARIRTAQGSAEARRIEAMGEADARQKLADAEAYRLDRVGRVQAEQMAREGLLVSRHPLLIQKALADKLSDKVQVIIAPPPADGGFIASALVGGARHVSAKGAAEHPARK
jgi:regulator of protease activity HflC (stomatin/prohibitin superfamily)